MKTGTDAELVRLVLLELVGRKHLACDDRLGRLDWEPSSAQRSAQGWRGSGSMPPWRGPGDPAWLRLPQSSRRLAEAARSPQAQFPGRTGAFDPGNLSVVVVRHRTRTLPAPEAGAAKERRGGARDSWTGARGAYEWKRSIWMRSTIRTLRRKLGRNCAGEPFAHAPRRPANVTVEEYRIRPGAGVRRLASESRVHRRMRDGLLMSALAHIGEVAGNAVGDGICSGHGRSWRFIQMVGMPVASAPAMSWSGESPIMTACCGRGAPES